MSPQEKLRTLGEWGFLNRLLPSLQKLGRGRFVVPPGDDAAVLKKPSNAVLSIDGLTEGTHFLSSWAPRLKKDFGLSLGRALGWKLMGSGLSDLAAMGDTDRRWAMIYLAAPAHTPVSFLMDFFKGVKEKARQCQCALAGGDTVRGKDLSMVVAVGAQLKGKPLTRSGAKPGDLLCVTGRIGDANAGLKILMGRHARLPAAGGTFVKEFFNVEPRFKEGRRLAHTAGVTSLMDLSDPLGSSINILTRASSVGARVFVEPDILACAEDYELLFTARPQALKHLQGLSFSVIGEITAARAGTFKKGSSFEHF